MATTNPAGRMFAIVLLVVSAGLSYQAWKNDQLTVESMDMAKAHACDLDSSCIVTDAQPRVGKADVFRHRYEFNTTHGMMTVTCKRAQILFGEWRCTPEPGRMVSDPIP